MFENRSRRINFTGSSNKNSSKSRTELLEEARKLRTQREDQKKKQDSAIKLQSFIRSRLSIKRLSSQLRKAYDEQLINLANNLQKPNTIINDSNIPLQLQSLLREILLF